MYLDDLECPKFYFTSVEIIDVRHNAPWGTMHLKKSPHYHQVQITSTSYKQRVWLTYKQPNNKNQSTLKNKTKQTTKSNNPWLCLIKIVAKFIGEYAKSLGVGMPWKAKNGLERWLEVKSTCFSRGPGLTSYTAVWWLTTIDLGDPTGVHMVHIHVYWQNIHMHI